MPSMKLDMNMLSPSRQDLAQVNKVGERGEEWAMYYHGLAEYTSLRGNRGVLTHDYTKKDTNLQNARRVM